MSLVLRMSSTFLSPVCESLECLVKDHISCVPHCVFVYSGHLSHSAIVVGICAAGLGLSVRDILSNRLRHEL